MNWLAHVVLSKKSIDYQLGNLLADPLKGKTWDDCSPLLREGIKMHKTIDAFTDSHIRVKHSKALLGNKGHLRGVVIDVVYDYLLVKNWEKYMELGFREFIEDFYAASRVRVQSYPEPARRLIERIIESDLLARYAEFEQLPQAFVQIDRRLSPQILTKESTSSYLPALTENINQIELQFQQFFPLLVNHFKSTSGLIPQDLWVK
jgi:acyl carrier protein phosphodiesterase